MGLKLFCLGVTIGVCVWAFNIPQVISIVAAILCIIGVVMMFIAKE